MSRVPIRLPKSNKPKELEKDILRTILEGLSALRVWHVRMNSGAMFGEYGGKKRMLRFGRKGMADLLACTKRVEWLERADCEVLIPEFLWIEVKRPGGTQSPDQTAFQAEVEAEGHRYAVVHSWEEALEILNANS